VEAREAAIGWGAERQKGSTRSLEFILGAGSLELEGNAKRNRIETV
jgi:hypothetical protein